MGYKNPTWPEGVVLWKHSWHFHMRLWQRYEIRLLPGEYAKISNLILTGKLKPVSRSGYGKCRVFKYIHEANTPNQRRIFIVAELESGRLVSVEKSKWRYKKENRKPRQRSKHVGRRSKKSRR